VVAILLTVSAIAIPNFTSALLSARNARTVADIHNIGELVIGYAAVNNAQYPNALADVDADKLRDPWGNPYQYLNLTNPASAAFARTDLLGMPINHAFDLYSLGPDGLSAPSIMAPQSQDDIIYAADGDYIGLAYLY